MTTYQQQLIQKAEELENNATSLIANLKKSYQNTGKLQAQDIGRIEKIYEQANGLRDAAGRAEG